MIILVDMDDTLAMWGRKKDEVLRANHPHLKDFLFGELQTTWDLMAGLDDEHRAAMATEMNRPGFYASLDPLPGAVTALNAMRDAGHEVWIVSTPWADNPTCMDDKYHWMNTHFGRYNETGMWGHRLILTHDKTLIKGDILFDDKTTIVGSTPPEWTQIYFTQPHNAASTAHARIDTWEDWESAVFETIRPLQRRTPAERLVSNYSN